MEKGPTTQMETAMYRAHGVCYEEYNHNFEIQIKVEKKREKDYRGSKEFMAEQSHKIFHMK